MSSLRQRNPLVACEGKERFDSQTLANEISRRARARHQSNASTYRCSNCGGWHLGTTTSHRKAYHAAHKRAVRAIREKELES